MTKWVQEYRETTLSNIALWKTLRLNRSRTAATCSSAQPARRIGGALLNQVIVRRANCKLHRHGGIPEKCAYAVPYGFRVRRTVGIRKRALIYLKYVSSRTNHMLRVVFHLFWKHGRAAARLLWPNSLVRFRRYVQHMVIVRLSSGEKSITDGLRLLCTANAIGIPSVRRVPSPLVPFSHG